jgi:hypothetical protein
LGIIDAISPTRGRFLQSPSKKTLPPIRAFFRARSESY